MMETSNLMLYTGRSSLRASRSRVSRKVIWTFVLVGGARVLSLSLITTKLLAEVAIGTSVAKNWERVR